MKTPEKIDLYKLHKDDYVSPKKPVLLHVETATYLAITGQGAPDGVVFSDKIGALYGAAFTIKMTRKFAGLQDYAICKLEGQYWCGECGADFARVPKDQWCWHLLIRTPEFVTQDELDQAVASLLKKGKSPAVRDVRLESLSEGQCVQMLHVGPYEREPESIALMKAHVEKSGLVFHGRHHEIYLSDPRRVAPERLKTILRIPVRFSGLTSAPLNRGSASLARRA
jgi:hypothetical protein